MLIFAIDDEELILEENKKVIEKAAPNAEIVTFGRAAAALEAIKSGQRPDVEFADIEIQGISGLDFAVKTKELSPLTRIVIHNRIRGICHRGLQDKGSGIPVKAGNGRGCKT
ncbi:MAG: response regulator [Butyrivibrio sp.]|nr:response regulator [Butyrivibrio sp.]